MPNPAALRERRLRKTKAQMFDEIDTLEQRAAAIEATYRSGAAMTDVARTMDILTRWLSSRRGFGRQTRMRPEVRVDAVKYLTYLRAHRCEIIQGYVFSLPVPAMLA